jgi:hypothetical protein
MSTLLNYRLILSKEGSTECLLLVLLISGAFVSEYEWPRQLCRYSDWLRAERPRGRSSSPGSPI